MIKKIHQYSYKLIIKYFPAVTCSALRLSNGRVSYNKSPVGGSYPLDTMASFSCNGGYSRSGSSSRTCQTSGSWSSQTPRCNKSNAMNRFLLLSLNIDDIKM